MKKYPELATQSVMSTNTLVSRHHAAGHPICVLHVPGLKLLPHSLSHNTQTNVLGIVIN